MNKGKSQMGTRTARMKKVTITLPEELVLYADRRADQSGTSRSQVISRALATLMLTEEEELAAEGYQFYAAEAEAFAAMSGAASGAAILSNTDWE